MIKKKNILIATGGTGGHIFPAYSLANYLAKNKYNVKLSSDKRGLQYLKDYKNFIMWFSNFINFSNIYSCWCKH